MRKMALLSVAVAFLPFGFLSTAEPKAMVPKVTEFRLERSGGKTEGLRDTLTLRSDGTASYQGSKNVDRIGKYEGKIPAWYFNKSFPRLVEMYAALEKDGPSTGKPTSSVTVITLRVVVDGKTKVIVDHCPGLDQRLWTLEMSIRGVAADIVWKKRPAK